MKIKKRIFGELEWQILASFEANEVKTVKEVHKMLGGQDSYTTIMTVMSRLAEKKQLEREKVGLQYHYRLPEKKDTLFQKVKEKLLGVSTSSIVRYLAEDCHDLTEEELQKIEELLEKKRKRDAL